MNLVLVDQMKREQTSMMELAYILSPLKAKADSSANLQSTAYPRTGNGGGREQTYRVKYRISSSKHLEIMVRIHKSNES